MNDYNDYDMFNNYMNIKNINSMMPDNEKQNLYGPYEGFVNGNLFRDLYNPYKHYLPAQLIPNSEKEEALINLNQMQFAMHEMNLLLDVYPNDRNALESYKNFRDHFNHLFMEYQNKYDSLVVNDATLNDVPFGWEEQSWPWEGSGM